MLKTVAITGGGSTGAITYQGTWNASTNSPTLTSSVGTQGDYYVVNVAGSTNLNGITDWQIGDWAVFNGSIWQKVDNTDAVTSVNGQTGTVVLTAANVGATPNTTYVLTSGLLSGGGQLNGNVTIDLSSVPAANVSGLGTMATQNANAVTITGGTINAVTFYTANIQSVSPTLPNSFLANSTTTLGNATLTLGSTTTSVGNLTLTNVSISSGNVAINVANVTSNTSSSATMATASLPLVAQGYLYVNLNGTQVKVPYYGV